MPWMDDEYLVDTRDRTLTPVTPELRYELSRIKSSTRRVIKAVSGEFERFVRDGYRVVKRAGEDLFRNPLEEKHLGPPRASKPFGGGWCNLCLKEGKRTPADWLIRRNWLRSDGSQIGVAGVYCCDRHKDQSMKDASLYHLREVPTRNPEGVDYNTMSNFMFRAGESALAKSVVNLLQRAGYRTIYQGPGRVERSKIDRRLIHGAPVVWSDAPKRMIIAASLLLTPPTKYNRTDETARLDYPEEYAILSPLLGKAANPHYNVLTKTQFDALKQLNRAYPKGDVYLGEIRLARGEQFSDALVAVEKIQRSTGIAHDVVQFQGKYYSAPQAWVDKVLVDARIESRAARQTAPQSRRSVSEQRGGRGGGGIRGAVKAGWRELMNNPGFVRSDREELGNAFVIHHEALKSGKVDGSGSRAIEAMIRRLGLSQREADYILELAGPGADNKRVAEVWRGLEETDPQWSREETGRIHDVRIEALGSPDWGKRENPRGRSGRGGRSSKPMPYPWEMPVRAAYSPRFMSKEQYNELTNLWHLSRVPASGANWGRYERMLWTAKEFNKKYPEISETAAYKDLGGMLSSGWRGRNPDPHDPIVIDNYLKVRRGAVFHGSTDNVVNRYRLPDGRTITVSGEGWYVSAGASYPEQSGKGVYSLNDWLVNEPARMKARVEAEVVEARKAKERKAEASKERSIKAFIEKLRAGIEKATGRGEVFYTGPETYHPTAIIKGDGVEVTVEMDTGRYFAHGIGHGFQPAKLFKHLAKYGEWEA